MMQKVEERMWLLYEGHVYTHAPTSISIELYIFTVPIFLHVKSLLGGGCPETPSCNHWEFARLEFIQQADGTNF